MSTRSQVFMKQSGIYLYQHWDGYNTPLEVQEALKLKARWDDEEYLTRIIFETMLESGKSDIEDDRDLIREKTLGYGIGLFQHSDIEWLTEVDVLHQTIKIRQGYNALDVVYSGSFEDFIKDDVSEEILRKEVYA